MRKNVKKFIFIIIILNCLLMFNNSYGVTYKKELYIDIAYKEWTMITRYIVASQNATIRRLSPEWYNLTSEQIKELDKNNNGKIDNNDLRIIKRHIEAMNNADVRKQHPDWIIYCEEYEVKNITLSETSGTLNIGDSRTIIATTGPTKVNNDEIVWQSNNTKVATVENGKITAISSGSAIITAKYKKDENIRAEYKLNVIANITKITLSETSGTLNVGESKAITAKTEPNSVDQNEIKWQSSDTKVATVENGKITAVASGNATIIAKYIKDESIKAEYKLTVVNKVTSIKINKNSVTLDISGKKYSNTENLTANITPDIKNKNVMWTIKGTDEKVVKLEQSGKISALKNGTATIVASCDGASDECTVKVITSPTGIKLNKSNIMIGCNNGDKVQLKATISPTNADSDSRKISWTSSNDSIATVSSNGTISAKKGGIVTITATDINGHKATCKITIYKVDSNGYKLFYDSNGKLLDGRTNYNISDVSKKADEAKIYSGTNAIIKTIGYENKYDYRIVINMDKKFEHCTLTVLAKDSDNKYTIPVRSSLCTVAKYAPGGGYKSSYKLSSNRWNKWRAIGGWYGGGYGPSNGSAYSTPGAVSYPPGFLHTMTYSKSKPHKINSSNYAQMGGAYSGGCIRLYWQDLKWIYENCPGGTKIIMNYSKSTKELAPFGTCTKLKRSSNKTQESFKYTLTRKYEKNSETVTCTINSATY